MYLAKLCNKVTLLVRKSEFKASKIMAHRAMNTENIEVLFNHETVEIIGEKVVEGVKIKNNITNQEATLDVTGFFLAIGHKPNTDIFKGQLDMDEVGYLDVTPGTTNTNIEGVYAAGDCADKTYRQAVTAAGTGCMAALDAERFLAELEH